MPLRGGLTAATGTARGVGLGVTVGVGVGESVCSGSGGLTCATVTGGSVAFGIGISTSPDGVMGSDSSTVGVGVGESVIVADDDAGICASANGPRDINHTKRTTYNTLFIHIPYIVTIHDYRKIRKESELSKSVITWLRTEVRFYFVRYQIL